ncbi:MAG: hypothetical protein IH995_01550 [Proteobacteria bacterium]|nr:hypothetical protein [Pseudomonadota bacterium]
MTLPDLMPLTDFEGDVELYLDGLYEFYEINIVRAGLTFDGNPISCRRHPETDGKGFRFWHIISTGTAEEERIPDLRRCETITLIPYILNNVNNDPNISYWENIRGTETNILIFLDGEDYLVILGKRRNYNLLKSAYPIIQPNRKRRLLEERDKFLAQTTRAAP